MNYTPPPPNTANTGSAAFSGLRCIDRGEALKHLRLLGLTGRTIFSVYQTPSIHVAATAAEPPWDELERLLRDNPECSLGVIPGQPLPVPDWWGTDPEHFYGDDLVVRQRRCDAWVAATPEQRQFFRSWEQPRRWGGKNAHIAFNTALYCEADGGLSIEEQMGLWKRLGLPRPTFMLSTGGKSLHNYWVLNEPIPHDDRLVFRTYQQGLIDLFEQSVPEAGIDKQIKSPSHVMRLAGWIHPKTGRSSVIIEEHGETYDLSIFDAVLPLKPTSRSRSSSTPKPAALRADKTGTGKAARTPREPSEASELPFTADERWELGALILLHLKPQDYSDRASWRDLAFSLHDISTRLEGAFDTWSARDPDEYNADAVAALWRSINLGGGITYTVALKAALRTPGFHEALTHRFPTLLPLLEELQATRPTTTPGPLFAVPTGEPLAKSYWFADVAPRIRTHILNASVDTPPRADQVTVKSGGGKSFNASMLSVHIDIDGLRTIYAAMRWRSDVSTPTVRQGFTEHLTKRPPIVESITSGWHVYAARGDIADGVPILHDATCELALTQLELAEQCGESVNLCESCSFRSDCSFPDAAAAQRIKWKDGDLDHMRTSPKLVGSLVQQISNPLDRRCIVVIFDELESLRSALIAEHTITWARIETWQTWLADADSLQYLTAEHRAAAIVFLATLQGLCKLWSKSTTGFAEAPYGLTPAVFRRRIRDHVLAAQDIAWLEHPPVDLSSLPPNNNPTSIILNTPHLLLELIAACSTDTDAAVTAGTDGITFATYNTEARDQLRAVGAITVLDATVQDGEVERLLNWGLDDDEQPILVKSWTDDVFAGLRNLRIRQMPWWGKCNPNQDYGALAAPKHYDALLAQLHLLNPGRNISSMLTGGDLVGLIDSKEHIRSFRARNPLTTIPSVGYFCGHRGSNRLRDCLVVAQFGLPKANMTAAARMYSLLNRRHVDVDDDDFVLSYRYAIGEDYYQALHRGRPISKSVPMDVLLITNEDMTELPAALQPQRADWVPLSLRDESGRTLAAAASALDGCSITITQQQLAERMGGHRNNYAHALARHGITHADLIARCAGFTEDHQPLDSLRLSLRINRRAIEHGPISRRNLIREVKAADDAQQAASILEEHNRWHGGQLIAPPSTGGRPPAPAWHPTTGQPLLVDVIVRTPMPPTPGDWANAAANAPAWLHESRPSDPTADERNAAFAASNCHAWFWGTGVYAA